MNLRNSQFVTKISLITGLLGMMIVVSILLGTVDITVGECLKIIGGHIPLLKEFISLEDIKPSHITIVMSLRLPRIILALIVGMGLSAAGCVYQGVFSNPMADPYLLGISSGAAFGATIAMMFNLRNRILSFSTVSLFAFAGAILILLFVFFLSKVKGKMPVMPLILSGIAMNYFIASMISLLMLFNSEQIESVYFWTLGSFKDAKWSEIILLAIVITISLIIIYRYYLELNVIMLHNDGAKSLGVDTEKVKRTLLVVASLVVALIVSVCGIIGFVGLIIPHATRMIVGPNHKHLIPFSIVLGGIFTIFSDTLARSFLTYSELSVGIITALFGVPFFLMLLYKNKKTFV